MVSQIACKSNLWFFYVNSKFRHWIRFRFHVRIVVCEIIYARQSIYPFDIDICSPSAKLTRSHYQLCFVREKTFISLDIYFYLYIWTVYDVFFNKNWKLQTAKALFLFLMESTTCQKSGAQTMPSITN